MSAHSRADGSSVAVDAPQSAAGGGSGKEKGKAAAAEGAEGAAAGGQGEGEEGAKGVLRVESYTPPDPGPYPQNQPPRNKVRFTPVQVEAVMAGEGGRGG